MVFESVVVDILNRYLKPYVKRLDTSQLKVGVWKGHAQLEKLELKEDLFAEANLDVPLKIKGSYIGKLEMKIPWKRLTKDPLVITIDEVYVILGPELETSYDPEKELKRLRKEKEKKIEEFEEASKKKKQKEKEAKKGKKKKKESDKPDSFTEKMVVHLMKNLLVKVRDIHVRYEDSVTNPNTTIAAGITLHSLELKSTDGNWQPTIVRETATLIYKLLELNCLGFYWTTYAQSLSTLPITQLMVEAMRAAIARPALDPPPTNDYLLMPMSATARLKMNLKPEADLSIPQLWMEVECEDIDFILQEKQYKSLLTTLDSFDRHALSQKYLKYKQLDKPAGEDLRGWWRYAITAVLEEDVKRRTRMWSWRYIKQHREVCRLYRQKYQEKVHSLSPSSSLLQEIQDLEDQLDWFNIVMCRKKEKHKVKKASNTQHVAYRPPSPMLPRPPSPMLPHPPSPPSRSPSSTPHLTRPQTPQSPLTLTPPLPGATRKVIYGDKKKEKEKKKEGKKKKGFFSNLRRKLKHGDKGSDEDGNLGGSASGEGDVPGLTSDGGVMERGELASDVAIERTDVDSEDKERREFYQAIGYAEDEEYMEFPKEYVAQKIFVTLNSLSLDLIGKKHLGKLSTRNITASVFNRPTTRALSVSASVGSMDMTGVPHGSCPTSLLSSQVGGATTTAVDAPLLKFGLELNPLDRPEMDVMVKAELRPIKITYDAETVDGLIEVFKPQKNIHLQELTQAASASWDQLKTQTTAGLQNALKDRKQIEVDVTLQSPFLVVPDHGLYSEDASLLVIDLGRLSVVGSTKNPKSLRKTTREAGSMDQFYDKFTVRLEGMQVLVAKPAEDWKAAMTAGSSPLHILDPTGFEVDLQKSIVDDSAYLPSLRVEGTLPRFEVKLSDEKLATLVKVGSSLEKPPSLINTTRYYDELPSPQVSKYFLDNATNVVDTISLDTMSVSSFGDEEEEEDTVSLYSLPGEREAGDESKFDDTSRHVFTDVSIKLSIKEIALKLTQMQGPSREFRQPILDIIIRNMYADVVDRKWDTQGSVSMGEVTVLDYITVDSLGEPTHLLKTEALLDGNFITTRFVKVTRLGVDFAAKYTGLQNSMSAQLSLIKLKLHRQSLATLMHYFMSLKPAAESPPIEETESVDMEIEQPTATINPRDVKASGTKSEDFHFDAEFEGIDIALADENCDVVHAAVKGFAVKGTVQKDKTTVSASMEDLEVVDPNPEARIPQIVSKVDKTKKMITLNVVAYNKDARERDPQELSWVDTSLKTNVERISVHLDAIFLANLLEFVKQLNINQEALQTAAKATASTAVATATAIKESTKSAHRVKLDITLCAPLIVLPYRTKTTDGEIYIDLGDFQLSNNELLKGEMMESCVLRAGRTILDKIKICTTSIQIYRLSRATACLLANREQCLENTRSTILEPLEFTVYVTRNISVPTQHFPNVDVQLGLGDVKFHLHTEDVTALLTIGLAATRISEIMAPPKPKAAPKLQRRDTNVCELESAPSGLMVPPGGSLPKSRSRARTVSKLRKGDSMITEAKIRARMKSVSLDITTVEGPLLKATASGLGTEVDVFKEKILVTGSVDSLSVIDLGAGVKHRKVVSLAEDTEKASSLELKVFLNEDRDPMSSHGEVKANIAQIQLILLVPFVVRVMDFARRLQINRHLIVDAAKAAQDSAVAVTTLTQDKYFNVDVMVHAPVLLLPVSEDSPQGFMMDFGSVSIQNTLIIPDHTAGHIGIDAYGIKLDSFKISRVIMDYSREGSAVVAERVLLQPFHMLLALERNLCPWYTSIPTLNINCTMGELQIFLGREDLEYLNGFVMRTVESTKVLSKGDGEMSGAIVEGFTSVQTQVPPPSATPDQSENEVENYTKVRVFSSLTKFEFKLFDKEPELTNSDSGSMPLAKMDDYALASLQLVNMELKTKVSSNGDVDVEASVKDIALCDEQKHRQGRNTGNRVIQHYTSNPLLAYTGKLDSPIIGISYLQRQKEHFILLRGENLLILSDLEFLQAIIEYFKAIFGKPNQQEIQEPEKSPINGDGQSTEDDLSIQKKEEQPVVVRKSFPKIKMEASIKNFRVAIIETIETLTPDPSEPQKEKDLEPQALTLKVSVYFHVQLTDTNKQMSLNIADLGISTSSFFNLDDTTSWVLLPCSMMFSLVGPLDKPGMDINGMIESVSLTLSPPVVRLIIHAVKTLIPEKEKKMRLPPQDLWEKKPLENSKLWFLSPVPLHKAVIGGAESKEKGETLTLTLESIEIILESESTQKSKGHPVLALNANAVVQMFEWTGELTVNGDIHCEASYYNEKLSVWEPLLEPLENSKGRLEQWVISAEVKKLVPKASVNTTELDKPESKFSIALSAVSPLQLTITKISLQLIKTLVEAYSKEYGKKVEGSVKVQTLTGAPFTIVNKLGKGIPLYLQPGTSLKKSRTLDLAYCNQRAGLDLLKDRQEFTKLTNGESVDMIRKREVWRRSYASLVSHPADENHTLGIAVGTFEKLQDIPISVPGTYYYALQPKQNSSSLPKYGLVVDVVVTGSKKTVTIRSPLQFYNHLIADAELWTVSPNHASSRTFLAIIKPNEVFAVPIDIAHSGVNFYVTPAGFGLQPDGAPIKWLQKPETKYLQVSSKLEGDDSACHFTRVDYREEKYKSKKNFPVGDFPHHIFHLHPPLVIQNLLPFNISVGSLESGCPMRSIEPGNYLHVHDLDLGADALLFVNVEVPEEEPLKGKFKLTKKPPEYSNFAVSASGNVVDLSVHTEDLAYMKMDIFSPFWMINKTGLTLEYKEGSKITRHPPNKTIQLLSTNNAKCKIQLGAFTAHGSHTDWTKNFPINAIGSSGNFTAKLGENNYKFGVEIRLSQFTLTKLVIVTPYYILVNETEVHLQSWESDYSGVPTQIPPGEVVSFWPLSETDKMVVTAGMGERTAAFNYKNSDFTVLKIDNELVALCVEVQESESATTVTFSPYYPGCTPVQIINHFPDLTLQFRQDSKSPQAITHTLGPQEALFYTWDDQAGRKIIKWDLLGVKVNNGKPIDISKDAQEAFNIKIEAPKTPTTPGSLLLPPPPRPGIGDTWLEVDESFSEQLVSIEPAEGANNSHSDSPRGSLASLSSRGSRGSVGGLRAHWKTFIDGLQRTLIFTPDVGVIDQIQAGNSYSVPKIEVSLSLRAVGLSLVDNHKKRELAYIAVTQSGVIWQVDKGKGRWKTLNNTVIELLEEAHQNKRLDIKHKNLVVNLATMEMYSPVEGKLRRTHHDGVFFKFAMSDTDYSIHAKIGHVQADNQLPFSVYPQVLYPLPPPPTVAPATEPKPFIEASVILRKTDEQSNVKHLKYVHVLVQKMAVNVDLGFILALVDFFSLKSPDAILETEYVKSDIEYAGKSLKETLIPELSDDFEIARTFFDVLHLAPIKITLSFNIRSVGKNKSDDEITVGDRFLELFLHSVGVILTSVQETEMKFSCFHLEYQTLTGNGLTNLLIKHYRTQALFQLHTLIFGLDVLGNPVSVVRGVVTGAIDLFYEPIKGSVLGPEEFFEGLGLGLRSFFGAGVVGGLTGAGARITGAFGDVFAKLTFDDEFIDKRQQEKARPPKLGSKLGGFAKNLFEGVTGVVTQPVKGLQKEGAVGLLKGTGRGLVGLLVRPTGGLVDLASGTLDFVTRKTQIGNFEISDIRPPRHIGRDGVVKPYSPHKALGTALLVRVDEGKFVESDYYFGHIQISDKAFVLVTDRRLMVIERRLLTEGWKSVGIAKFKRMASAVEVKDTNVIITYASQWKGQKLHHISVRSGELASEIASVINQSYHLYTSECAGEWSLV